MGIVDGVSIREFVHSKVCIAGSLQWRCCHGHWVHQGTMERGWGVGEG